MDSLPKNYDDLIREVSHEEQVVFMSNEYRSAFDRIQACKESEEREAPIRDLLLKTIYKTDQDYIDSLGEMEKDIEVRKRIYQDLLVVCMYDPDGTPSDLNLKMANTFGLKELDIKDYKPISKNWATTKSILEQLAPNDQRGPSPYGNVSTLEKDRPLYIGDVVERYATEFTKQGQTPAAISIPFTVDLGYKCRIDNNTADFREPFGGEYSQKIVFLRR